MTTVLHISIPVSHLELLSFACTHILRALFYNNMAPGVEFEHRITLYTQTPAASFASTCAWYASIASSKVLNVPSCTGFPPPRAPLTW